MLQSLFAIEFMYVHVYMGLQMGIWWPGIGFLILSPLLILSMEKTMVTKVITLIPTF